MESRDLQRVLVGKPEGKSPLERHRRRWEDNKKRMDVRDFQMVLVGNPEGKRPLFRLRHRWEY
jgi:hypothetical protein